MSISSRCRFTRVEIVTSRATPSAVARPTTSSSSTAKSGKSRWQWLSISMMLSRLFRCAGFGLDIARKYRRRGRQFCAGGEPLFAAETAEIARVVRHRQEIKQLLRRARHEGLRQDGHLPDHVRGDVEDRAHAGWI